MNFDPSTVSLDGAKYTLIRQFSTGSIFIDILVSTLIGSVFGLIFQYKDKVFHNIYGYIQKLYCLLHREQIELYFNCLETRSIYGGTIHMSGSDTFKGFLWTFKDNIRKGKITGLEKIREFTNDCKDPSDCNEDSDEILYIIHQNSSFSLTMYPHIKFSMNKEDLDKEAKPNRHSDRTLHTLCISSRHYTLSKLQELVENVTEKYKSYIKEKFHKQQYVFVYEGKEAEEKTVKFTLYPFYTTCSINTVFFENKETIMKQVDFFRDNKQWYERRGKPYTLGICSYGVPGCGKTSFEKAIAKYLNRHLFIVDFSKIKTQQEADKIFFSEKVDDIVIPYSKRIYIFPDIDRMSELICKREISEKSCGNDSNNEVLTLLKQNMKKGKTENSLVRSDVEWKNENEFATPLNLSKILNILDGIPERTGQIIMMSANNPERIDPALLRAGRIDCMIRFTRASYQTVLKMVYLHFEESVNDRNKSVQHSKQQQKILDQKWTPAELFQICTQCDTSKEAYSRLIQQHPEQEGTKFFKESESI